MAEARRLQIELPSSLRAEREGTVASVIMA